VTAASPAECVRRALVAAGLPRVGVAVSGGGDSTALLLLAAAAAPEAGVAVEAVTVDHRLRTGSAAEAEAVGRLCAQLGVPHRTVAWPDPAGRGNLADRARRARQTLISAWAGERGIGAVLLGHTADDQAETVLMRLARASGVDGLSAMAPVRRAAGLLWLRPLLGIRRSALRDHLRDAGVGWAEDPSNEAADRDRIRMRRLLPALEAAGIGVPALAAAAAHLRAAREALAAAAAGAAARVATVDRGDVLIDAAGLAALAPETRRRLLAGALLWIGGAGYAPRAPALDRLLGAAAAGRPATLAGCRLLPAAGRLRLVREARAAGGPVAPGACWDGRWTVEGPGGPGLHVAALGAAGLALCPAWRGEGLPRASQVAGPAVWRGDELVAAPLAGRPAGWRARLVTGRDDFVASLFAH
jgi:tRNA(Ile)-lysidine synthase